MRFIKWIKRQIHYIFYSPSREFIKIYNENETEG